MLHFIKKAKSIHWGSLTDVKIKIQSLHSENVIDTRKHTNHIEEHLSAVKASHIINNPVS